MATGQLYCKPHRNAGQQYISEINYLSFNRPLTRCAVITKDQDKQPLNLDRNSFKNNVQKGAHRHIERVKSSVRRYIDMYTKGD